MSVSRIYLLLAGIAIVVGLVTAPALTAPLTAGEWSASIVAASDKAGQGWFGG